MWTQEHRQRAAAKEKKLKRYPSDRRMQNGTRLNHCYRAWHLEDGRAQSIYAK
jgi:hypothetical protein